MSRSKSRIHVDDLEKNMLVAVTGYVEPDVEFDVEYGGYYEKKRRGRGTPRPPLGMPLKILSINLPYIAVTDGYMSFPIDAREARLVQVSKEYAKILENNSVYDYDSISRPLEAMVKNSLVSKPKKNRRQRNECPTCGNKMVQRLIQHKWFWVCNECGFGGSPVVEE